MELRSYPAEALMLIEVAQIMKSQMIPKSISKTTIEANGITENKIEEHESYFNPQEVVIADQELWSKCTSAEWHLIGRISTQLYLNNALWKCAPEMKNNSSVKKAIKGLLLKNILAKTSVTNFYIVNPAIMRRGTDWKVALTTAQRIHDNNGIDDTLLRKFTGVDKFEFINHNNTQQIGYGYYEDSN